MEDRNIESPEDLSVFSYGYGSSPNIGTSLRCTSNNKNTVENTHSSTFPETIQYIPQNVRNFSPLLINSLRRIIDSQAKSKTHHQGVTNEKNLLKISSQKMKLRDKENSKTRPFSPKTSRNSLYSKKEHHPIVKKNQNKKPKETPLKLQPDVKRNISKQKRTEIVKIEVFMPIIDEKNNKIIYPSSKKPAIKRYFVNKNISPKSNKPRLKNKYANKTVNEISVKQLVKSPATKKPIESFSKSVNNPVNKADAAKTVKNALAAKKSSAKEFKPEKTQNLEKGKAVSEIRYFFKENTVDIKNRPVSDMKAKSTRSMPIEGVIGILVTNDSKKNQNNCFATECFKNQNQAKKCANSNLPFKNTPNDDSDSNSNCSSDNEFIKENMDLLVKSPTTKKQIESFSKSVNNPGNKADAAKTVKNAFAAKKSSAKEFKPEKASNLEKGKVVSEIRYFFKESTVDIKNRPVSDMKTKRTRSMPIEGVIGILVTNDSKTNQNDCFSTECFKNQNQAKKCVHSNLPVKKTPNDNSDSNSNFSSDIDFIKENMDLLEKVEELKSRIKNCNPQENARKSISSKIPGAKLISNNTRSNRGRNAVARTESKSPVNRKMSSNKNDENGWRRSVYNLAKGNSSVNKWRRRLENDDGLSIESWIDRCKYLRDREEFLGKYYSSRWRSG